MTKTFTSDLEFTAKPNAKDQENPSFQFAEPSSQTLQTILNYSKNLESKRSTLINHLQFIKS